MYDRVIRYLAILFASVIQIRASALEANYDFENKYKVFENRVTFSLQCNVTSPPPGDYSVAWYKGNQTLSKTDRIEMHRKGSLEHWLTIKKPTEAYAGTYSCHLLDGAKSSLSSLDIEVIMKPTAKLVDTLTVIEGEKLRLECLVNGVPAPTVVWRIGNSSYRNSAGRIKLVDSANENNNGLVSSVLEIEEATMDDRGDYFCYGENLATRIFNATEATVLVRVKDKLAALWPFLGICAEVVVLCAIIFIYEKKRNKTELEESDTDQSPEQDKK